MLKPALCFSFSIELYQVEGNFLPLSFVFPLVCSIHHCPVYWLWDASVLARVLGYFVQAVNIDIQDIGVFINSSGQLPHYPFTSSFAVWIIPHTVIDVLTKSPGCNSRSECKRFIIRLLYLIYDTAEIPGDQYSKQSSDLHLWTLHE